MEHVTSPVIVCDTSVSPNKFVNYEPKIMDALFNEKNDSAAAADAAAAAVVEKESKTARVMRKFMELIDEIEN